MSYLIINTITVIISRRNILIVVNIMSIGDWKEYKFEFFKHKFNNINNLQKIRYSTRKEEISKLLIHASSCSLYLQQSIIT